MSNKLTELGFHGLSLYGPCKEMIFYASTFEKESGVKFGVGRTIDFAKNLQALGFSPG